MMIYKTTQMERMTWSRNMLLQMIWENVKCDYKDSRNAMRLPHFFSTNVRMIK